MSIGINIKKARKKMNLTQYDLAAQISKDVSTISKIETNKAKPSVTTLSNIAKALGVTVSELLNE